MKPLLSPFNVISLLILSLGYGTFWLVTRPQPLPDISGLNDGGKRVSVKVQLFYSDSQTTGFKPEDRQLEVREVEKGNLPQLTLDALLEGSRNQGLALVPRNAEHPTVFPKAGHLFVDLPKSWTKLGYSSSGEMVLLCGITRTLLSLSGYKDVTFMVGGKAADTLLGSADLTSVYDTQSCDLP